VKGQLDLTARDWAAGPVALAGEWAFEEGFRKVPDEWTGNDAGGPDGRGSGSGTYRLKVNVGDAPPLALRFGSVSTAFLLKVNGVELARGGSPDADAARARSAYAPGTVRLPPGPVLDVEFFVSNHDYRVGGLWTTPVLGPADAVVRGQWFDEVSELTLAIGLGVIGLAALVLFGFRPSEKTFLPFGAFALLIALRSLVTGEYTVVKLLPGLPFDAVVRLEYLTAFLLLPAAAMFFSRLFPGVFGRWPLRAFVGPGLGFTAMALAFPLAWLTRSIPWFYPTALIQLVWGISLLSLRFAKDKQGLLFLVGLSILSVTALADLVAAAVFSFTATWIPWGLGAFIVLQAASMAQRFLAAVEANERLLADKEFLVREIHHRVKNSLQLVASIVTLQANRIEGPMKAVFQSLRRRITAIALVHEKLHGQGLGERSDLGGYLRDLLKLQYPDDELMASGVVWDIDAEQLTAGIDYCIDAGLILTELVGNAYKHALVPRGGGRLQVEIKIRQGRLVIEVADDGAGFPAGFQPEGAKGLGFRLVLTLLQRNDGTLMLPGGPGGRVRVELRLPAPD
jgi:two-component sensor histidine kinase